MEDVSGNGESENRRVVLPEALDGRVGEWVIAKPHEVNGNFRKSFTSKTLILPKF